MHFHRCIGSAAATLAALVLTACDDSPDANRFGGASSLPIPITTSPGASESGEDEPDASTTTDATGGESTTAHDKPTGDIASSSATADAPADGPPAWRDEALRVLVHEGGFDGAVVDFVAAQLDASTSDCEAP